jgi:hypothetical protein
LLHRASQIARMRFELGFEPDQAQERFVDRIDFEVGVKFDKTRITRALMSP